MKAFPAISAVLALFSLSTPATPSTDSSAPIELVIKWRDGPDSLAAAAGNQATGAKVTRNFPNLGWQHVTLPAGMSMSSGVAAYRALDGVLAVEVNGAALRPAPTGSSTSLFTSDPALVAGDAAAGADLSADGLSESVDPSRRLLTQSPSVTPNDPRFGSQWNLKKISAPQAWSVTTGSSNVVVAVVDTGVNYRHPDLIANMWVNPGETGLDANGHDKATNGIDDDGDGYIDDVYGINVNKHSGDPNDLGVDVGGGTIYFHGSALAGVIGAVGNNGIGISGINWNVRLMAVALPDGTVAEFLEAVDYIIGMKKRGVNVRVISNSWFTENRHPLADVIDTAGQYEILTVLDASNNAFNNDVWSFDSPNSFWWLSVAGSDQSDALVSYSDWGRSTVDLAAPTSVPSTLSGATYATDFSGDSAAQPHGAAAAALLAAAKPDATALEIKAAIRQGVDHPAAFRTNTVTGGRLNLAGALQALTNTDLPPIVVGALPVSNQTDPNAPIQIAFSRAMDRASVEAAFQITPSVQGTFQWTNDDHIVRYIHSVPFQPSLFTTNYTCRILGTAHDVSGRTLDGNFNRAGDGSPADDFVWTFSMPLANDDFANAKVIAGPEGAIAGTTRYSTFENGEPLFSSSRVWGLSVWYKWTPDTSAWVTFDLTLSNKFDTVLGVFTGDQLATLVTNIFNDNYGTQRGSRVSLPATAGVTYSIKVAAKWPGSAIESMWGDFLLRWYPTPAPLLAGTEFLPASSAPGQSILLTGTNFTGATGVLFNGTSAYFAPGLYNNLDLQLSAVVPTNATSGPITVVTPYGNATSTNTFIIIQPPSLAAQILANGNIEISWVNTADGFALEAADQLSPSAQWTTLAAPSSVNSTKQLNFPIQGTTRYFRLRKP